MTVQAIETRYAGHRFRSRLEARWAVFFDTLGIKWEYEPQGYVIDGTPYLPDFLLADCGTWVEVKGNGADLDRRLMSAAAGHLPEMPYRWEAGPRLLILGPIPEPRTDGDWGWLGLTPWTDDRYGDGVESHRYGFGLYRKNRRPWVLLETSSTTPYDCGDPADGWLVPALDPTEPSAERGYAAARSARFEHGRAS
ncbi:hypothetical protein ACF090_13245 [Streptomyces sp. NPDC014892]|uniref:hypothetical protein n=1 Tax=Streptomyces sp. NPDC014892 TaxID=3364930 RepID=UPI003700AD80